MATSSLEIIKKNLEVTRPSFDQLNLNGLNFFKEMEYAAQRLADNSYLAGANPETIRNSLVNVAMSGLTLSPIMKMAYLVPRSTKVNGQKVLACTLEPSYIGLVKILTDTNSVAGISANIVYEKETGTYTTAKGEVIEKFQIQVGIGGWVKHTPYIGHENPGKPIACYSIALLPGGVQHVELLRPFEWEPVKARSESVKSYNDKKSKGEYAAMPTWLTDEGEMIRKTCIKKHYKYLPKTERAEQIAKIIDLDNQANGIDFSEQQKQYAEPAAATPNAAEIAMATGEDFNTLIELLDDPALPETIFDNINKAKMKAAIEKRYAAGTLEKSKAEEYIKGLTAILKGGTQNGNA